MADARRVSGVRRRRAHARQSLEQADSDPEGARSDVGALRLRGLPRLRRALSRRAGRSAAAIDFLLAHFGEVVAKRGSRGTGAITNRLLNPYPLSDADRDELRRLAAHGVFVSDHLGLTGKQYLAPLLRDRFENSIHTDIIGSLIEPRGARVLEVRSRAGTILDGLRRAWGAEVFAMPIWESQQFLLRELFGITTSPLIDFEHFAIPFDGEFDLIVCNHMFTHALRPRDFFGELRRKLKPGGHIYLYHEPDDAEFLAGNQSMFATLNPLHMQAFDQASLVRALAANGFETVFIKGRNLHHLVLARLARTPPTMTPMTSTAAGQRAWTPIGRRSIAPSSAWTRRCVRAWPRSGRRPSSARWRPALPTTTSAAGCGWSRGDVDVRRQRTRNDRRASEKAQKIIADNRKALHDYHILDEWEAGVALLGTEVKAIREGRVNLRDSYARLDKGEIWLINVHISPYSHTGYDHHDERRQRKLLLHRHEIQKMAGRVAEKGLTLVPLRMYFKNGRVKVALALAKGKQAHDKRETIRKREVDRETRAAVKARRR